MEAGIPSVDGPKDGKSGCTSDGERTISDGVVKVVDERGVALSITSGSDNKENPIQRTLI